MTAELLAAAPNSPGSLIPVVWAGTNWNTGDNPDGTTTVVTDVNGWEDSPAFNGNDVALALGDGVVLGNKIIAQREVTVSGMVAGPRPPVLALIRQLAALASARQPVALTIGQIDETGGAVRSLTAQVRADTSQFQTAWLSRYAFTWQVVLTAADPLLYDQATNLVTLTVPSTATGWVYPRRYPWHYAGLATNSAQLANAGTAPTPVTIIFTGPLSNTPEISDGARSITLKNLGAGEVVTVESDTLAAFAPGGATRASYVLAGSVPMPLATGITTWTLYATGTGNVVLTWASAWA